MKMAMMKMMRRRKRKYYKNLTKKKAAMEEVNMFLPKDISVRGHCFSYYFSLKKWTC
jgi:hypothetical protein